MDHDGTPSTVGNTSLDHGFFQLREFSLFFDFFITDTIIASTEVEAGDNGNIYTSNYAYVDLHYCRCNLLQILRIALLVVVAHQNFSM